MSALNSKPVVFHIFQHREKWLHALRCDDQKCAIKIDRSPIFPSLQQCFQRWTWLRAKRGRPSVVILSEFPRWRLRCDENNREIEMRVCVIRIFRDGLEHLLFCLLLPAFLAGSNAEVIVPGRTVWVELDCFC